MSRYAAIGNESLFEPGSRDRVLRNRLRIRRVRDMQQAESDALLDTTHRWIDETSKTHRFTSTDVRHLHRDWLGKIYPWAGQYRTVNVSKAGFHFAAAAQVPKLMHGFTRGVLHRYTPGVAKEAADQAMALALVHAELVLIHPFRDGNGRCARLLATLMALQMDLPPLDFGGIERREKRRYIDAIHRAMATDYAPMQQVMRKVIARSMRLALRQSSL